MRKQPLALPQREGHPQRRVLRPRQQAACDQALMSALDTSEQSPIFAEVNPSDSKTVHDFKYPSATLYMAYREAILAWLQGEQL